MVVLIENFNLGYKMSLVLVYRKIIITINQFGKVIMAEVIIKALQKCI